jgi:hypothetical protein
MFTNQGRFGAVIPGKVIVSTQQIWWNDRRPSTFFFTCIALHMDGYKEHGCQVHVEEATSPTKLGSFCLH